METITRESPTSIGSWCLFVRTSETRGVKLYASAAIRDAAMKLQHEAWEVMCGPEVFGILDSEWMAHWRKPCEMRSKVEKVYGYVTEVVNTETISPLRYSILLKKLSDNNISTRDLSNNANIGSTKDGNMVRYDFDPIFAFEQDDPRRLKI